MSIQGPQLLEMPRQPHIMPTQSSRSHITSMQSKFNPLQHPSAILGPGHHVSLATAACSPPQISCRGCVWHSSSARPLLPLTQHLWSVRLEIGRMRCISPSTPARGPVLRIKNVRKCVQQQASHGEGAGGGLDGWMGGWVDG